MAKEAHKGKTLDQIAEMYGVGQYEMHFFLCTGPDCCTPEVGNAAWGALKDKTRQIGPKLSEAKMYRTTVGCLRMCQDGPMAVCYPQGQWFKGVTADKVADVIDHIVSGNPEPHPLQFTANPLSASGNSSASNGRKPKA
ncbi:MAG TPA: (2Fe-2S) ferredoxin domain-containing protein [bacterium]